MNSAAVLRGGASADTDLESLRATLVRTRPGEVAHEAAVDRLRVLADPAGAMWAQWQLGAYLLSAEARPGAVEEAAVWLRRAAEAGLAPAMDRLADLHLRAQGMDFAPDRALALQLQLAERGYYRAAWEAAYLASRLGRAEARTFARHPVSAATLYARACALGNPQAYYSLGLCFAEGRHGAPCDPVFAKALLQRAADGRIVGASEAASAWPPEADPALAAQWHRRLKANLDAAQPGLERLRPSEGPVDVALDPLLPRLEAHLAGVGHPALALDAAGRLVVGAPSTAQGASVDDAPALRWLSERPRVAVADTFASREECDCLLTRFAPQLSQARQYVGTGSANDLAELQLFSGEGVPIGPLACDSVVRMLERRVLDLAGWQRQALEPCSIIRYRPGQAYQPHVDYFNSEQIAANPVQRMDFGGQRVATFLVYLRAPKAGGETEYVHAGLKVKGEPGMAVLHYNVTPDGEPDPQSLHAGRAVVQGEKWLWRSTLRAKALVGPLPATNR